jgi:hypothetical protein
VAHTFDELVHKRRAADQAHSRVQELRGSYGPPTQQQWTARQSDTYETAVRAWRDLDRDWRAAMNEYIRERGEPAQVVEAQVRRALEAS